MLSVDKDMAYFLHQTPYRDNSALVHLFTQANGKVSFIVQGLQAKKHKKKAFLQPCRRLSINYQLKSQLSKLTALDFADDNSIAPAISQFMLYQYANELLLTLLPPQLPLPPLFDDYARFLQLLSQSRPHAALRYIELALITLFSGLPDISRTQDKQMPVQAEQRYYFYAERGLFAQKQAGSAVALDGAQVLAFEHLAKAYIGGDFSAISETLAQGAKALTANLMAQLLGDKTLKTRTVYRALQHYS